MPELYIHAIDDGEQHWVAAEDEQDALAVMAEQSYYEQDVDGYVSDMEPSVARLSDGELIDVKMWDEPGQPVITKTCREWCDDGRGMIATTNGP